MQHQSLAVSENDLQESLSGDRKYQRTSLRRLENEQGHCNIFVQFHGELFAKTWICEAFLKMLENTRRYVSRKFGLFLHMKSEVIHSLNCFLSPWMINQKTIKIKTIVFGKFMPTNACSQSSEPPNLMPISLPNCRRSRFFILLSQNKYCNHI